METILQPAQQLPVIADVDVCVVGGGTAGIAAALGAARAGASTMLIEAHGSLGGQMTLGYVNMLPVWDYSIGAPTFGGVMTEMIARLQAEDAYWLNPSNPDGWPRYDVEVCQALAVEMLLDAGVRMRLHSWVSGAILEDGAIKAVTAESVEGRAAITARSFIDATGDAVLAHVAGAEYETAALRISLESIGYIHGLDALSEFSAAQEGGLRGYLQRTGFENLNISYAPGGEWSWNRRVPGICHLSQTYHHPFEGGEEPPDGLDVDTITRIENETRLTIHGLVKHLRADVPGCEDMIAINVSDHLGVRWTRLVTGDYRLTHDDTHGYRRFEDCIARCGKAGEIREVPYRCIYSRNIENLWVGGRCASYAPENQHLRIIPICIATGQAAGVAAAFGARAGLPGREVPIDALTDALIAQGVALRDEVARIP